MEGGEAWILGRRPPLNVADMSQCCVCMDVTAEKSVVRARRCFFFFFFFEPLVFIGAKVKKGAVSRVSFAVIVTCVAPRSRCATDEGIAPFHRPVFVHVHSLAATRASCIRRAPRA